MRRFLSLFMQDLTVVSRNALMWVVAGALVVIILVVLLLIPADYDLEDTYYFYDASEKGYLEQEARQEGLKDDFILGSLAELEEAVLADPGSIGVYFTDTGSAPQVTILHYGTTSEQNLNLIAAALEDYAAVEIFATDDEVITRVEQNDAVPGLILEEGELILLFEGNEPEAIIQAGQAVLATVTTPDKLVEFEARSVGESSSLFREILFLSLIMLALLLGGVVSGFNIIDEKDTKAVNALAVTPLGLHRYIAARTLGAVVVAALVTFGTALILVGSAINYLLLAAVIAASILIIAALTLSVGGFASNQVSAIAVIKVLMPIYLALPIVSLFVPERWQAIFYPLPNYWQFRMLKGLFSGAEVTGQFWLAMLLTFLLSGIFLIILLKITRSRLMPAGGE